MCIEFYGEAGVLPFAQAGQGLARRYDRDQAVRRLREIRELKQPGLDILAIQRRLGVQA